MRRGMPSGTTAGTLLWMPMRGDSLAELMRDRSTFARTVSRSGTGSLEIADTYYGVGLRFASEALVLSGFDPGVAWSLHVRCATTDPTVEHPVVTCALYPSDPGHPLFELWAAGDSVTFTAYDDVGTGTPFVVTSGVRRPVAGMPGEATSWTTGRTLDIRVDVTYGAMMEITIDGALVGRAPAPATHFTVDIGALRIGRTSSDEWHGTIADVQIRSGAQTWPEQRDALPVNLSTAPVSRRQLQIEHVDLPVNAAGFDWDADVAEPTLLALPFADLVHGALILHPDDVRSVTSSIGTTTTTLAPLGNRVDLLAATNSFMVDMLNSLILLSPDVDPADADTFAITVRMGWATATGIENGPRYYPNALQSEEGGERRHAYFDQPYPTGGGGDSVLAARHPDLPADFASEEVSSTLWSGATTERVLMTDGMPLSEAVVQFGGFCDGPPAVTPDTLVFRRLHETARLFRVPMSRTFANIADYPHMSLADSGYVWPVIMGPGHKQVRAICIDQRLNAANGHRSRWKICDHPIAAMQMETDDVFHDVDLRVGEFWIENATPGDGVTVSVDGYGAPDPPTYADPGATVGDPTECYMTPRAILTALLGFAGILPATFGTTWDDTDDRVLAMRRFNLALDNPSALATQIHNHLTESLTHLWWVPATRKLEWRDVVKADAIQHTIRDVDVVREAWLHDKDRLSARASGMASTYVEDHNATGSAYLVRLGEATTLLLKTEQRYGVRDVWPGSLLGFLRVGQVDLWFAIIRRFLEEVSYFYRVTVGEGYADVEQMDVIDVQVSTRPLLAGNRFRVLSVKPIANGLIEFDLFAEELYPADGTSVATTRDQGSPFTRWVYCEASFDAATDLIIPTALADTSNAWTVVANSLELVQGVWAYPADVSHRFQVRALRTGGASDAALQFRLVRCQADGTYISTIGEIAGVSTTSSGSGNFPPADITLTVPTVDTLVRLEYKADGCTGKLWCASWEGEDGTSNTIVADFPPTLCHSDGFKGGVAIDEVDVLTAVPMLRSFCSTTTYLSPGEGRVCVYVDPGSRTDLVLYAYETSPAEAPLELDSVEVSSAGFYELDFIRGAEPSIYSLFYQGGAGAGAKVYAWSADWRDARP